MLVALAPLSTPEKRNKNIQLYHLCSRAHQLNATLRDNTFAQMHTLEARLALHKQNSCHQSAWQTRASPVPQKPHACQPQRAASLARLGLFCIRSSRAVCSLPLASSGLSAECCIQQWLSYSRAASGRPIHCPQSLSFSALQLLKAALTSLNTCLRHPTCGTL